MPFLGALVTRSDGVPRALPFWGSLALFPLIWIAALWGGWALLLPPLLSWGLVTLLDALLQKLEPAPERAADGLWLHRLLLDLWGPCQFATLAGLLVMLPHLDLAGWELFALFYGLGIASGTIGITYAHELIHRPDRRGRWLGDLLLASVMYSHFRSEHLHVHHVYVATPQDTATARFGESFWAFFYRVLPGSLASAWAVEAARQARRGRPLWHRSNPFWRYGLLQGLWLGAAFWLGGPVGFVLFLFQALVAIWQLELVNYVEHYGLTRARLANGRYEPVQPHHSWDATQRASNWLLINLQRHADHHMAPGKPFPLLRSYGRDEAPRLPYGYPAMTVMAMIPPLWMRRMNPKVLAWRQRHYPQMRAASRPKPFAPRPASA